MTRDAAPSIGDILGRAAARLEAAGIPDARVDAEWLLADLLRTGRAELWTRRDRVLTEAEAARFEKRLARRVQREPLQHILGQQEFHGLAFEIDGAALIPRPETETLVDSCLTLDLPARAAVLDVGTGSGCIAIALAVERPQWRVTAIDTSDRALALARRNARLHGVEARIALEQASLVPRATAGPFDLVVSNPPYVGRAEWEALQPEVRDHDPQEALVAGPTGLEVYAALIPRVDEVLRPSGWLALELGAGQATAVRELLEGAAYEARGPVPDLRGIPRVLLARKPKNRAPRL